MMKIRKGDTVQVISGDDKGMTGTVRRVIVGRVPVRPRKKRGKVHAETDLNRSRVLIAGVNLVKKHQRRTGDVRTQFGIIEREAPVHSSNVALVCPHCQQPTKVGYQVLESGGKARFCKRCQQTID